MLSLSASLKSGQLREFIAQQEAAGIGPIDRSDPERLADALIRAPRSEDRTSHSAFGENSSEKKIRRDSDLGESD
jgi:hypothetical protein